MKKGCIYMKQIIKKENKRTLVTNNNIMLSISIIFIVIMILFLGSQIANAKERNSYIKSFTTIEISAGDTLLSIADAYKKPNQNSYEYIDEVIAMNNIADEQIHAGCYLVIPVYEQTE